MPIKIIERGRFYYVYGQIEYNGRPDHRYIPKKH